MIPARSFDLFFSAAVALLGLFVAWQGITYGYKDGPVPAAGYFPFWIGLGMIVFSGLNLLKILRHEGILGAFDRRELARVGLISLSLGVFVILSAVIGMIASSFLLMIAIGVIFGARDRQTLIRLTLVAVVMTGVVWLVFGVLLAIPLQ